MPIKQTEHMLSIGFGKLCKVLYRWWKQLGWQGPQWSLGRSSCNLQVSNDGEAGHIQNTDHLLLTAQG